MLDKCPKCKTYSLEHNHSLNLWLCLNSKCTYWGVYKEEAEEFKITSWDELNEWISIHDKKKEEMLANLERLRQFIMEVMLG